MQKCRFRRPCMNAVDWLRECSLAAWGSPLTLSLHEDLRSRCTSDVDRKACLAGSLLHRLIQLCVDLTYSSLDPKITPRNLR